MIPIMLIAADLFIVYHTTWLRTIIMTPRIAISNSPTLDCDGSGSGAFFMAQLYISDLGMRSTADICLSSFKELLGFRKPKQEMGDWTHKYQYEKMKRVILTYLPFYFVRIISKITTKWGRQTIALSW